MVRKYTVKVTLNNFEKLITRKFEINDNVKIVYSDELKDLNYNIPPLLLCIIGDIKEKVVKEFFNTHSGFFAINIVGIFKKDSYNKEYDFIDYFYEIDNEKVFKIFFDNFIKLNNNHWNEVLFRRTFYT